MKRFLQKTLLSWFVLPVAVALAQPTDMGGYSSMRIDSVGVLEGGFDGTIKRMADGVSITLMADDAEMKDLPIRAGTMNFTWAAGEPTPSVIVMEGNVEIDHPQAHVTAQRAEWNFEAGTLTFSGNPIMKSEQVKEMRGERMILNFNTNTFEVRGARVSELPIKGGAGMGGGSSDPNMLTEGQVTDWTGLVSQIKKEASAGGASPGKQIISGLPASDRTQFEGASVELIVQNKGLMVKAINRALGQTSFYNKAAWEGKTLSSEAQELLAKEQRTAQEQTRLNRLLLQSAYPGLITAL